MQHYISKSPWSGPQVIKQVRQDITSHPHFAQGNVILSNESADNRRGRCWSVVAVNTIVGWARLILVRWGAFSPWSRMANTIGSKANCSGRKRGSMRHTRNYANGWVCLRNAAFQTKLELFWQIVQRCQAEGVAFDVVTVDALYGQSCWLRQQLDQAHIEFYADVPPIPKSACKLIFFPSWSVP